MNTIDKKYQQLLSDIIEFGVDDIVRSGLVKEYILAKIEAGF